MYIENEMTSAHLNQLIKGSRGSEGRKGKGEEGRDSARIQRESG